MRMLGIAVVLLLAVSTPAVLGADFDGDSRDDIAVFRPSTGLWSVRGVTRTYFGARGDTPSPGDYNGDGIADFAVHRSSVNLWIARGITRTYYGNSATDTPLTGGGGGQRIYDYVVRPGDGDDLEAALASDVYRSVFIPAGNYAIDGIITVDHVTKIVGEDRSHTSLNFANDCYLAISTGCKVEGIRLYSGGMEGSRGNFYVRASYVTVENCISEGSASYGFQHASGLCVSFIDCITIHSINAGFKGCNNDSCRFLNCSTCYCGTGFADCRNLANCEVQGFGPSMYGRTGVGFSGCVRVSNSYAYECDSTGFLSCSMISSCWVNGGDGGWTDYGFRLCSYISSCHAENCSVAFRDNYFADDVTTMYSCN